MVFLGKLIVTFLGKLIAVVLGKLLTVFLGKRIAITFDKLVDSSNSMRKFASLGKIRKNHFKVQYAVDITAKTTKI